jgi:hypothetical protein
MVGSESCTAIHQYLCRVFDNSTFSPRGDPIILGYDDACHLKPFSTNPKRLTAAAPKVIMGLSHAHISSDASINISSVKSWPVAPPAS